MNLCCSSNKMNNNYRGLMDRYFAFKRALRTVVLVSSSQTRYLDVKKMPFIYTSKSSTSAYSILLYSGFRLCIISLSKPPYYFFFFLSFFYSFVRTRRVWLLWRQVTYEGNFNPSLSNHTEEKFYWMYSDFFVHQTNPTVFKAKGSLWRNSDNKFKKKLCRSV